MREIKFRAKRVDKDEFVYGDHLTGMGYKKGKHYILPLLSFYPSDCYSLDGYEVVSETIGQYTGLKDKNGKEIYEGDIIVSENYSLARHYVRYIEDEAMFVAMIIGSPLMEYCGIRQSWIDKFGKKIIGNIHDNPELIKKEESI